jgi:hypothetical protein
MRDLSNWLTGLVTRRFRFAKLDFHRSSLAARTGRVRIYVIRQPIEHAQVIRRTE